MEIRGFTVKYAKTKAKRRKNEELTLQNKIERNPNNNHAQNELIVAILCLQKIMHFKTKGAILRSKVRWCEEGKCNTRYFFGLENGAQTKKAINKLKINNNTYIYDQLAILDKQKKVLRVNLSIQRK